MCYPGAEGDALGKGQVLMSDEQDGPTSAFVPAPLEHHTVTIAFDLLARSAEEAAYIVRETLMEDLAAPGDAAVVEGDRVFGEDYGEDVASIRSWIPVTAATGQVAEPPADLVAWRVLRSLASATPADRFVLRDEDRARLVQVLGSAERDVVVPDPAAPDAAPLYEGPASEAHRWLPSGTYQATGLDGGGKLRLIVQGLTDDTDAGESIALTSWTQDAAAMDRVFFLLEGIGRHETIRTLHALNAVLAYTGRPQADLDLLPPSDGSKHPLLRGLLGRREAEFDAPEPPTEPGDRPGPGITR